MTPQARGKLLLTLIIIGVIGGAIWRFWDKVAPTGKENTPTAVVSDLTLKLLKGTNVAMMVNATNIPPVKGTSDYKKETFDGKMLVRFPINVWPGWAPILVANNGLDPNKESIFYKRYGFYVKLDIVDNPVQARDLFASGQCPVLWGTLDMMALFAPSLCKDSRTVPVIPMQVDFSAGGDGLVVRGDIKSVNDLHMKSGVKRKIILAQNSPSHYFIIRMMIEAGIDPSEVDFRWAADAPSAAKIFVQDSSFDGFVGWSPDIYTVTDGLKGTRLLVTSGIANHTIADVWAVRNDFFRDNPEIVINMVRAIFEGMDSVRKDPASAARIMAQAFSIPESDCKLMIGEDGGIQTGDAHLTNYRENNIFFLDESCTYNFDVIWNSASAIYQQLGAIDSVVPAGKVKAVSIIQGLASDFKDSLDLSQPTFGQEALSGMGESDGTEVLTKSLIIQFEPNSVTLNDEFDPNIPAALEEIGKVAGAFGNAYIIIEGNADASHSPQLAKYSGGQVVPADLVRKLSYDRAESVMKAVLTKYKFDPKKFKVVGNGWDKPTPGVIDMSNEAMRKAKWKQDRRVEIKVIPFES
jgi:NitT/TauT family transport system substrate-binding protein